MCLVHLQAKQYHCLLVGPVLILFSAVKLHCCCKGPLCYVHLALVVCTLGDLHKSHSESCSIGDSTKSDAVILCSKSTTYEFLLQTNTSFIPKRDHFLAFRRCSNDIVLASGLTIYIGAIATN